MEIRGEPGVINTGDISPDEFSDEEDIAVCR